MHQDEQSTMQQPLHGSSPAESHSSNSKNATFPSEPKRLSFDASAGESSVGFQTSFERSTTTNTARQLDRSTLTEKLPQPLAPLSLEPDISLTQPPACENVDLVRSTSEISLGERIRPSSCLSARNRDIGPASDTPSAENIFSHLNLSRATSSMLAHCDQNSLAPPCESLAQTQCGRMTLRQAGIPHGSSRALAPSLPIENIAVHPQNEGFLRRLMRKAFAKSLCTTPPSSSRPSLVTNLSTGQGSKPQLPRATRRHSLIPAFTQTDPTLASEGHSPSSPKRSPWTLIQRFVAKPNAVAKAAQVEVVRRTRPRASTDIGPSSRATGVQNLASGHSSSVSFFGDPMTRADPFARPGGLGATVSPSTSPEPFSHSVLCVSNPRYVGGGRSAYITNRYAHYISFPTGEGWGGSRDQGMQAASRANIGASLSSTLHHGGIENQTHTRILACGEAGGGSPAFTNSLYVTARARLGRRHSVPLLNVLPPPSIGSFQSRVERG